MNNISFLQVVPEVFASADNHDSEIWDAEATFRKGDLYLVEAASGKGKSTFCSYILGYRCDYTGKICFDKTDISTYGTSDWVAVRQQNISCLFQELRLFPELTAYENVEIKNRLTGFKTKECINRWFEMLGIDDKRDVKVGRMSFGQQQRVAMMRALVQPFDFLLADEPISHLDDCNSEIMGRIMLEEAHAQGAGVIVTSIGKHIELEYDKIFRL